MTPDIILYMVAGMGTIVGTGGAAWAGVRTSLNGTRERVTRIENKQDRMSDKLDALGQSLARMEGQANPLHTDHYNS